jgi:hypothetical protein
MTSDLETGMETDRLIGLGALNDFAPQGEVARWLDEKVGPLCLSTRATRNASFALARYVARNDIPGDIVECGVFAGGQVAAMAVGADCGRRRIHLFDSFEGIPHAGPRDSDNIDNSLFNHGKDGALITSGISSCSAARVLKYLAGLDVDLGLLRFWPGWFQFTVPLAAEHIGAISLLRLDGDLYESTKACFPLLDLVSDGGIVIVDDFALRGCREAIEEYRASRHVTAPIIAVPEGGGPVFWIRRKAAERAAKAATGPT